jgi:hypothetical protein
MSTPVASVNRNIGGPMMANLIRRRFVGFQMWWHAPATRRDRIAGIVIGGAGCFWIGVLGRITLGALPVSLEVLGWWALGSTAVGMVLGAIFPKAAACLFFPFSTFGVGT